MSEINQLATIRASQQSGGGAVFCTAEMNDLYSGAEEASQIEQDCGKQNRIARRGGAEDPDPLNA